MACSPSRGLSKNVRKWGPKFTNFEKIGIILKTWLFLFLYFGQQYLFVWYSFPRALQRGQNIWTKLYKFWENRDQISKIGHLITFLFLNFGPQNLVRRHNWFWQGSVQNFTSKRQTVSKIWNNFIFTRESSYCFQRVLAIAILSVCLSVCHTGGSVKNGAR